MIYDAIVIGGGITGAGILRDLVQRGFSAVLLEMDRPGMKTTAISSGLIHGGLRYLPYDFRTTWHSSLEAGIIRRLAPELHRRMVFLWPIYRGYTTGLELVEALIEGYDDVSGFKGGKPHVRLSAEETLSLEPHLRPDGLKGSVTFDEWSIDAVKLVEMNLEAAEKLGARVAPDCKMTGFIRQGRRVAGVKAMSRDNPNKETELPGKVVINATGPWAEQTARLAGIDSVRLRLRKGAHLIIKCDWLKHGVLFPDVKGRYIGAYPRGDELWIGPTDDDYDGGPDHVSLTDEDKSQLIESVKNFIPGVSLEDSRFVVGVRPILFQRGFSGWLSRDYKIFDHEGLDGVGGFITAAGGKLTVYRKMAEETVDLVCEKLGRQRANGVRSSFVTSRRQVTNEDLTPFAVPWPADANLGRFGNMLFSLLRLAYCGIRHFWRLIIGHKRRGLELYRETYERG
ncbi:MAG: FAD-dependent oxidoreductase [Elusimicrobia bacterium]|nr:FAD-dependent oxidoreductase [Elusimicrobiota bacterium]